MSTAPDTPAPLPFSAAGRASLLEKAEGSTFDLLVVGGGITGAGIALDAACRGLSVALVEASDFASGTSGTSSRLIHGGLRYLETLDLHLVFEALAERRTLLRIAPHLVHPLEFLFPVYRGEAVGIAKLLAGMWLYDTLSLFRGIRTHRMLSRAGIGRREPALAAGGLRGGAVYADAQVDDARLTLAVARAAHEAGACLLTRSRVTGFLRDDRGRLEGARVVDTLSGRELHLRARLVLGAAGPWTDELRRLAHPAAPPRLRPTKGVHIVLPRERVGNHGAIIFRSRIDGRVMFVLPWGDFTYVGTTDTDIQGSPDDARADAKDVEYLLRSANALFPAAGLTGDDVVGAWAGVRPLLAPAGSGASESQTSREHEIWRDPGGLLCIAGGKLTTYRVMAAEAVNRACEILKREHGVWSGDCSTADILLPGAPDDGWESLHAEVRAACDALSIAAESAEHLARAYGTEALLITRWIAAEPALARPILPALPYLWAEVRFAVRDEMALTLEDVMRRRLHLTYEDPAGGLSVAREIAERMATEPALDWDADEIENQLARYRAAVASTRPAGHAAPDF